VYWFSPSASPIVRRWEGWIGSVRLSSERGETEEYGGDGRDAEARRNGGQRIRAWSRDVLVELLERGQDATSRGLDADAARAA